MVATTGTVSEEPQVVGCGSGEIAEEGEENTRERTSV